MDRARLVRKLIYNALRYRFLKFSGRPGRLEAISLEITHRCFCRCQMCNIWQIPKEIKDLPLPVWTGLLSSAELVGLREIDITGGEPFLHQDLGRLLEWVCQVKAAHFPKLKTLAITSNGILTDRILELTATVIGPLRQQGIDLVLACGMDAVGPLHDEIRNFPGAWDKLKATIKRLKQLREKHSNLILGIKTTIVPQNVAELEQIATFARDNDLFTIISPCIITANRFGNLDRKQDLSFNATQREAMKRFYSGPAAAWSGHSQTVVTYLDSGVVKKPCSAGFNTVFVRHNGDLFPCPVIPNQLGNVTTHNLKELLTGSQISKFRRQIGSFSECQTCTEPGLERIAWPYEGGTCLHRMTQMGSRDFIRLVTHMGLDKYLA